MMYVYDPHTRTIHQIEFFPQPSDAAEGCSIFWPYVREVDLREGYLQQLPNSGLFPQAFMRLEYCAVAFALYNVKILWRIVANPTITLPSFDFNY